MLSWSVHLSGLEVLPAILKGVSTGADGANILNVVLLYWW